MSIARTLNESGGLPWRTDRKHIQDRLRVLMDARRVGVRSAMASTGADDEAFGEAECLLDDLLLEDDERQENERVRRASTRKRDKALLDARQEVRDRAMRRTATMAAPEGASQGQDVNSREPSEQSSPSEAVAEGMDISNYVH